MKMNYFTISLLILFCFSLQAKDQYVLKLNSEKGSYIDGELITEEPINGVAEIDARIIISEPGTFVLMGNYTSQIKVTLTDPDGYVTLILNGTNITNPLGPAILFTKTHEMDNTTDYSKEKPITHEKALSLNFSDAGSKVIIADDTENYVVGYYSEKFDGALYSKTSMAVYGGEKGNGKLTIWGNCEGCEGLDSDLHMEINGGIINIASGDDGINGSEDFGSAVIINGGNITINAGSYADRGDGIDANGILIINGGNLVVSATGIDAGLEGETAITINGGRVMTVGSPLHSADPGCGQIAINLFFGFEVSEKSVLTVEDLDGNVLMSFCPATAGYLEGTELHKYSEATISVPEFETFKIYKVFLDGKPLGFSGRSKGRGFYGGFGGYGGNYGFNQPSVPRGQMPEGGNRYNFGRGSDDGKNKDKRSNNYYKINQDNGNEVPKVYNDEEEQNNYNRYQTQLSEYATEEEDLDTFFIITSDVDNFSGIKKMKLDE